MTQPCYFCKGKVERKKINHVRQWGDKFMLFENMEADVCGQCGEIYFSPENLELMDSYLNKEDIKKKIEIPVVSL